MSNIKAQKSPILMMLLLVLAGESIFMLPFVLARIFRPTFLEVFDLNNFQLGALFSIYGIVTLLSYLLGGTLADKFKPRKLMAIALLLTSFGGVIMATYPSYAIMKLLFGYWGFTTIFLFWGAMIKATRIWGGQKQQGIAFGLLEGGRGLVAASMGTVGVLVFSFFIEVDITKITNEERKLAFRYVILITSLVVAIIGLLVLLFMKSQNDDDPVLVKKRHPKQTMENIKTVLKIPAVWLLMVIILCAYVGYKLTDVFSLYAKEVMLYNEIEAAQVGTFLLYIRPVVCVGIGLFADKSRASIWILVGFFIMFIGAILFASGIISPQTNLLFMLSLIITATGVYGVRTLYFAAMPEGKIPLAVTGTAIGIISVVGYTPDIFVGPIMGYLLDNSPDETGHQHVFMMLAIFAVIGLIASWKFYKITTKK